MVDQTIKGPTVVCSAFIEQDGKVLIVFCTRFKVWRVPGGRAEYHESLEETVVREMKEEIGVTLKHPRFVGWGQDHQFHVRDQKETSRLLMFFHAKVTGPIFVDPDEAEKHKWVTLDELRQHKDIEGALMDFFSRNPGFRLSDTAAS